MSINHSTRIIRVGKSRDGENYFDVEFTSHRKIKRSIVPAYDLTSTTALRKIGVVTSTSRSAFNFAAEQALRDLPSTFEIADRAGWSDKTFVWPDGECTGDDVPVCLRPEYRFELPLRHEGTLHAWEEFFGFARGNSRLMLVTSHAFTGPVVDLLGVEAPAIQLVGEAGVFKSSLCSIVALMWGMDSKSWHATDNGGEQVALARHASHLVLDDFRVDKRHSYSDMRAYAIRLTDGRSKERMDAPGRVFSTPILSSSNRSLGEHARLAGLTSDVDQAALQGRLIDIPLLTGRTELFEELHGQPSARDLIELMTDIARENPCIPAVRFVRGLQKRLCADHRGTMRWLKELRAYYEEKARAAHENLPGYDLARVHGRFATIYAAGRLAIDLRLLRWSPKQFLQAVLDCQAAHVALVADTGQGDLEGSPLTALRRHVDTNQHKLVDLRNGLLDRRGHDHEACPGYLNRHRDSSLELLFPYLGLVRICGGRAMMPLLRSELRRAGALFEGEARPSVKRYIYCGKDPSERENVVAVRAELFKAFRPPLPDHNQ